MEENMGMKSTLIDERVLGSRGSLAGDAPDSKSRFKVGLAKINQELWLVLSLFIIAGLFNWLVASRRMILGLYTLPTIFSAYVYGRRHAVLTASASIFMVLILHTSMEEHRPLRRLSSVRAQFRRMVRTRHLGLPAPHHRLRNGNPL